jgi:hypothetical protein
MNDNEERLFMIRKRLMCTVLLKTKGQTFFFYMIGNIVVVNCDCAFGMKRIDM